MPSPEILDKVRAAAAQMDTKKLNWVMQWLQEATRNKVRDAEDTQMRHEHFGREKEAQKYRSEWLPEYRVCQDFVEAIYALVREMSAEKFAADFAEVLSTMNPKKKDQLPKRR